jgi:hypothetical protein
MRDGYCFSVVRANLGFAKLKVWQIDRLVVSVAVG